MEEDNGNRAQDALKVALIVERWIIGSGNAHSTRPDQRVLIDLWQNLGCVL